MLLNFEYIFSSFFKQIPSINAGVSEMVHFYVLFLIHLQHCANFRFLFLFHSLKN